MEKYSKAVRGMYSQFNQREAHPMEKYIGGLAKSDGTVLEVVGYRDNEYDFPPYGRRFQNRRMVWVIFRPARCCSQKVRKILVCQY